MGGGLLAVMAKPVAGEWIHDEFSAIAQYGINKVVSLLETDEAYELGLDKEAEMCEHYGMKYLSYSIADRGVPNSVNDFAEFTLHLYQDVVNGVNTVIHCRAGIGRTGLVAAGVLLHCGLKPEDAFAYVSDKRRVGVPDTQQQVDFLIKNAVNIKTI